MKFPAVLKIAAAALLTGALVVPAVGTAQAVAPYPPSVSTLYASPTLSKAGNATVTVTGDSLVRGMTVKAARGSHSQSASVSVNSAGTTGTAKVKVGKVLPSTAGRYTVNFTLKGGSLAAPVTTAQTYTVGKAISIKSFSVKGKSYGLLISGKAAKKTPVTITVKIGSKSYSKKVTGNSSGAFSYHFTKKKSAGTYTVSAKVAPNKKYFSDAVTTTYVRS